MALDRREFCRASAGAVAALYFPLTGPHTPLVPAPRFQGKSKAGPYGDWVHQIDWACGQVLDALDRSGQAGPATVARLKTRLGKYQREGRSAP